MKKICLSLVMATLGLGMLACDEGEYNDLACDAATYKAECLDTIHFMVCGEDGKLIVRECATGQSCSADNATADNPNLCK